MKTKPKAPYHSESELYMMMDFTPKKIAEYIAQLEAALDELRNPHRGTIGIALERPSKISPISIAHSPDVKVSFAWLDSYMQSWFIHDDGKTRQFRFQDKKRSYVIYCEDSMWFENEDKLLDSMNNETIIHIKCRIEDGDYILIDTSPF